MIYLGADPEFFLMKNKTAAVANDAWATVQKDWMGAPYIERDGLVAEIKTPNPHACRDSFNDSLQSRAEVLREFANANELTLKASAWEEFDSLEMEEAPETAKEFGCRVDFNAYTLQPNKPECPPELMGRPAGGHLHFGVDGMHYGDSLREVAPFVIGLDYTIGLLSTALTPSEKDKENERRKYYGQAGAFRLIDSYHVEYRTPSGATANLIPWINLFQGLGKMMTIHFLNDSWDHVFRTMRKVADPRQIVEIINTHDHVAAESVLYDVLTKLAEFEATVYERNGNRYWAEIDENNYESYKAAAFESDAASRFRYMGYVPSTSSYLKEVSALFIDAVKRGYRPNDFELDFGYGMHSTAHGSGINSLSKFLEREKMKFNGRDDYDYYEDDEYYDDDEPCNCEYCR
jgi:hypothetical protein